MNRTLPVSMYFSLSAGKTLLWKLAQWLHVSEAYSTIVTGASAWPRARSGRPRLHQLFDRDLRGPLGLLCGNGEGMQHHGGAHGAGSDGGEHETPRKIKSAGGGLDADTGCAPSALWKSFKRPLGLRGPSSTLPSVGIRQNARRSK